MIGDLKLLARLLAAVSFAESAASLVVDSNLLAVRPRSFVDCRRTAREMANDMMEMGQDDREMPEQWVGEQFGVKSESARLYIFRRLGKKWERAALRIDRV